MLGLSFGEFLILCVIAIVVVGPRKLPSLLRSAGQLVGRLRRMAMELRTESGIDEILDAEGIRTEIDNFKRLASGALSPDDLSLAIAPDREREYPRLGPDGYGAISEDLGPYAPADQEHVAYARGAERAPAAADASPDVAGGPVAIAAPPAGAAPLPEAPSAKS